MLLKGYVYMYIYLYIDRWWKANKRGIQQNSLYCLLFGEMNTHTFKVLECSTFKNR